MDVVLAGVQIRWTRMSYRRSRFGPDRVGSKVGSRISRALAFNFFAIENRVVVVGLNAVELQRSPSVNILVHTEDIFPR